MYELVTMGVILKKEPAGDFDAVLTIYTEKLGKVSARATSLRKITSKLAAHTEPGILSVVRLVSKNPFSSKTGFRLVDSLREKKITSESWFLDLIDAFTIHFHEDAELWRYISSGSPEKKSLMGLLGYGGNLVCGSCRNEASLFNSYSHAFLCGRCGLGFPQNMLLKL